MTSVIEVIAHHSSAISRISSWLAMRGPIALVVGRVLAAARRATAGSLTAGSMRACGLLASPVWVLNCGGGLRRRNHVHQSSVADPPAIYSLCLLIRSFFFLNAYLLQERRHLAPAKDTEAKTRFRR